MHATTDSQDFRSRLRLAVERDGRSCAAISRAAGLSTPTVWYLLNRARNPQLDTMAALASALGVSLSWLASGRED